MLRLIGRPNLARSALSGARRFCGSTTKPLDVLAKAQSHSIRLSETERSLIERDADTDGDGVVPDNCEEVAHTSLLLQNNNFDA